MATRSEGWETGAWASGAAESLMVPVPSLALPGGMDEGEGVEGMEEVGGVEELEEAGMGGFRGWKL